MSKTYHITDDVQIDVESFHSRQGEPHRNKNKIYVWLSKESIGDNLMNRRSRPYTEWKTEVIPMVMEWLKEKMPNHYNELKTAKWGWRQNCGCGMCPCSPGFVSDTEGYITIHVNISK